MNFRSDIEENVRSGLVELLILHLLTEEDMYGYQIRQELAKRTDDAFVMKEGSLYGPLYRMSERKLISSHKEMAGEKRFRNYYHIEPAGREYGKKEIKFVFAGVFKLFGWQEGKDESKDQ